MAPGKRLVIFRYPPDKGKGRFHVRFACHRSLRGPKELKAMLGQVGLERASVEDVAPGHVAVPVRPP